MENVKNTKNKKESILKLVDRLQARSVELGVASLIISQEEIDNLQNCDDQLNGNSNYAIDPLFLGRLIRLEKAPEMFDDYVTTHIKIAYTAWSKREKRDALRYAPWLALHELNNDKEIQRRLCHLRPELSNPKEMKYFIRRLEATVEKYFNHKERFKRVNEERFKKVFE